MSSVRPSARHRVGWAILVTGIVTSCASAAPSLEPTQLERPAVPEGWHALTSDARDVRLSVPPDVQALFTASGVIAQEASVGGMPPELEVMALGPASAQPQPRSGEPVRAWLDASWLPRSGEGGVTELGPVSERQIELPSGQALEVAVTVHPSLPDASRVLLYAISVDGGVAILRFVGPPDRMEGRAADLRLMALLAEFGDLGR